MQLQQQVPLDIIYEIRGRLPPKSLVRFRCISKAWNDITNDLDLARKQLLRSGKIRDPQMLCLVDFQGNTGRTITSKISKQSIVISIRSSFYIFNPTCCNGWHCFGPIHTGIRYDPTILMHNPLRQETLELPQIPGFTTKNGFIWYGLGFDARNNVFKLTCLYISTKSTTEFYILRQKQFWEQLELPSCLRICINPSLCKTVFLNGSIHYVVGQGNGSDISTILAFDVEKEQFRCIDLPRGFKFFHLLMDLGGVLAAYLFQSCTDHLNGLYLLKDYVKGEWDASLRLPVSSEMGMKIVNDIMGSWGTQVLFCAHKHNSTYDQYHAYDIQTGKFTNIDLSHSFHIRELYGHQLSLVPLHM